MDTLPTVYLISGANRGIGLQLIQVFSTRPNVLIFAGTRQFPLPDDHPLSQLSAQFPNKVYPLELNSADEADNHRAAQYIGSKTHKLDVIIANAGVSSDITPIATVSPNIMLRDFEINSLGPLILFQTMRELVSHSPDGGKFIVVSSVLGQIEESLSWASNAYGTSKAAVNFITKKIHIETPNICAFPIHPGLVDTQMGTQGVSAAGMDFAQLGGISTEQCVKGMLKVIDASTRETHGGKFWSYRGQRMSY